MTRQNRKVHDMYNVLVIVSLSSSNVEIHVVMKDIIIYNIISFNIVWYRYRYIFLSPYLVLLLAVLSAQHTQRKGRSSVNLNEEICVLRVLLDPCIINTPFVDLEKESAYESPYKRLIFSSLSNCSYFFSGGLKVVVLVFFVFCFGFFFSPFSQPG